MKSMEYRPGPTGLGILNSSSWNGPGSIRGGFTVCVCERERVKFV